MDISLLLILLLTSYILKYDININKCTYNSLKKTICNNAKFYDNYGSERYKILIF